MNGFTHFSCHRNTQNLSSFTRSKVKRFLTSAQNHSHFFQPKYLSDQEIWSYANQSYVLTKWEITDLDLLQIEKYTLADRWILKFFLNCLNACFFGDLTNTGKRESRRKGRRWKVLKKHIININYSSDIGWCFLCANKIKLTHLCGKSQKSIYVQSRASLNAWSGLIYQSLCLLLHKMAVYISVCDTLTTRSDEAAWHTKGWLERCGRLGQTSTSETWNIHWFRHKRYS